MNQKGFARAAAGNDSRAFLAAMLEGEEPVIGQDRGVRMSEYAEKSALVLRINFPRAERLVFVRRDHTKTSTNWEFIQLV